MCGFIFHINKKTNVPDEWFIDNLNNMSWRGPDAQKVISENNGSVRFGHCRLSILDPVERSDQPMVSMSGRYVIVFNGEIYNHVSLRESLSLTCKTVSDTETILEGYALLGERIFEKLEGMFALVIYDKYTEKWVAARDSFGIKPLFIYQTSNQIILSSEAAVIANMTGMTVSEESLNEWRIIRRPIPGRSFFNNINEVLPGTYLNSDGVVQQHWEWESSDEVYSQDKFEELLTMSVSAHELSDVDNVSLLSGGLDSAIISALSNVEKCYTVGLVDNNEFDGAEDTANFIQKKLTKVSFESEELVGTWEYLTRLRGEPLSLPNEGLIYKVCKAMESSEKVVLTGEGADELLFGYDGIYRWSIGEKELDMDRFIGKYGYSEIPMTSRLSEYVDELNHNKTPVEFVEDFFYQLHLPGLLRRMDFASMAASKEARVPFVDKSLIKYMYRKPSITKINDSESKIPIRRFAKKLGLDGALERKKIGFSAQVNKNNSRKKDYKNFQDIILNTLQW